VISSWLSGSRREKPLKTIALKKGLQNSLARLLVRVYLRDDAWQKCNSCFERILWLKGSNWKRRERKLGK
jgi:hypothetical protein